MKGNTSLTESIGSARGGESDPVAEQVSRSLGADERPDPGSESVAITITSSTGYEDSEIFMLRGKKAANTFARRAMALCLRSHNRGAGDGE